MEMNTRNDALALIKAHMRLRTPQSEALESFHAVISTLHQPLSDSSYSEVTNVFKAYFPEWTYHEGDRNCPEMTAHLATGVGKTKFIGALIAYLFRSGDSKHFLIVTPRAEIVRKFIRELHPESPKYIFSDKSVIHNTHVFTAENYESKSAGQIGLWGEPGPTVWVLSPQSFTAKGARIKADSDFGNSLVSELKKLNDLVVFFDESHHLSDTAATITKWKKEIHDLEPRLIIGTTASVRDKASANLIYSYPLKRCLKEKLFTKQVQIIAEKVEPEIGPDEQDHIALRYALNRRAEKEKAIAEYCATYAIANAPKPILLVCCADILHAEETYSWLTEYMGNPNLVRVIHSELSESEYIPWLMNLERDENQIRVIVQVSMLNEGWDVSTVYCICPLRQMNSITMVEQVMGRGLRLPFSNPTGDKMVDELDIICFGRKSVQELANEALAGGYGTDIITVREVGKETAHESSVHVRLVHCNNAAFPTTITIPGIRREPPKFDLASVSIPRIDPSEIHGFEITDPQTLRKLGSSNLMPRDEFLSVSSSAVIRRTKYLSESREKSTMLSLISNLLDRSGFPSGSVPFSPEAVASHVARYLDSIYSSIKPTYVPSGSDKVIQLKDIEILRPETFNTLNEASIGSETAWAKEQGKRQMFSGWKRCIHNAVPFDVYHELTIARCIDRCPDISWWFRNLPSILTLDTPAGRYSPDFAILITLSHRNILLEVKGDIYAESETSTSRVKKDAAELWCKAASEVSDIPWEYWFLLDSDAKFCNTWADIETRSDKGH